MSFALLGLAPELLRAVQKAGYENPTAIQERAIPAVLAGRDVLGCAQTGTGKTAAFTLPLLQRLARDRRRAPRALVLTPTRELAAQAGESIRVYGRYLPFRSAVVFGGVGMQPQIDRLNRGVDILVATPGRLLDLMGRGIVDLARVEILVLDEADRMLDMGFIHDVRRILAALPRDRQTLLFSATLPAEIEALAGTALRDPVLIEVGRRAATTEGVRQTAYLVEKSSKRELLLQLLRRCEVGRTIIFTRTKHGADRLGEWLGRRGLSVAVLHSNKSQQARTRALQALRDGSAQILVATDIAARGLDVEGISHVFNFDLPGVPEDYVHRIGRTARAEATGDAVSLVEPGERKTLREIEKLIKLNIPCQVLPGFEVAWGEMEPAGDPPRSRRSPVPQRGARPVTAQGGRRPGGAHRGRTGTGVGGRT